MQTSRSDVDVLDDGKRGRRPWLIITVTVLIALALLGKWGDAAQEHREFNALLAKTADAQATATAARAAVLSTRQYTMPLLVSSSSTTVRTGLEQLIEQSAAKGKTRLEQARKELAQVTVLPWHHAMRHAQQADLAYLDQRIADFEQAAKGADLAVLASAQATTAALAASAALQSAAPSGSDAARVATTFGSTVG